MIDTREMTYELLERAEADYKADTFGKGVAGVQMEHLADVFCGTCARDILGDALFARLKTEDLGHDHDRSRDLGNVTAVLASTEWDCPGATCGHCGIELGVRVIHYDGVCQPDRCDELDAEADA